MKLLGVFIANGFASEARVAAALLRRRSGRYDALALHHSWDGDRESAARFEAASGVSAFRFDAGWRPNPRGETRAAGKVVAWAQLHLALPRLLREALRFRPDAVYSSQQTWDCYAASWIAGLLQIPQVIHLHYTIGPYLGRATMRQLRRCERIVTVSEFIRREALRHGAAAGAVTTVVNAVEVLPAPPPGRIEALRSELGLSAGQPVAAIIARVAPGKGHADTLDAFAAAARKLPSARLLLVGEGTRAAGIEADIAARGLREKVRTLGFRQDVQDLLGLIDVFVHPSRKEPFGLGVLEAAAAGKPVVAYDDGGIPEIVVDGQTGFLVETGDRSALAAALLRLLEDGALARRMGEAGRERTAQHFRPDDAGARFAEVIMGLKRG